MKERIKKLKKMSLEEIINASNLDADEKALIAYSGANRRMIGAKNSLLNELIAEVYNTDENGKRWEPDWKNESQPKWYPVFNMARGVGFSCSRYAYWNSFSVAGSRFCFEFEELSDLAAKQFPEVYKELLTK